MIQCRLKIFRLIRTASKSNLKKIEIHNEANFSEVEIFLKYLNDKNLKPKKIKFRIAAYGDMVDIDFFDNEKVLLFVKKFNTTLKNINVITDINNFMKNHTVKISNIKIRQADEDYEIDFTVEEIDEV